MALTLPQPQLLTGDLAQTVNIRVVPPTSMFHPKLVRLQGQHPPHQPAMTVLQIVKMGDRVVVSLDSEGITSKYVLNVGLPSPWPELHIRWLSSFSHLLTTSLKQMLCDALLPDYPTDLACIPTHRQMLQSVDFDQSGVTRTGARVRALFNC